MSINFDESAARSQVNWKKKCANEIPVQRHMCVTWMKTINSNDLKVGAPKCRNTGRIDIEDILCGRLHAETIANIA